MSIEVDVLRYIGLYEEPDGSYQVDHSDTPGDFLALPYKEGTLQAKGGRAQLDPMTGKMRLDGHDKKVLGIRSCTLAAGITLHSHGLDLDGDEAPPTVDTWALMRALKAIMGGVLTTTDEGVQTVVVSGSTTTTAVEVTAGHGVRFEPGGVIACQVVSGSPLIELREVASVAGDVVTVKEAFSAVPVTGTPVRGGVTFYLTEDPKTALQAIVEGREAQDGINIRGLQGGFTVELPVGELGTLTLNLQGAGWERLASGVTIPSYSHYQPMACIPLELHVPTIGDTTRVVVEQSSLKIEPNIVYAPQKSGAAAETIARMRRQAVRPAVKGSFTCPYEDDTWYTARDDREDRALFAQVGALPGESWLISAPTIQITDVAPAPSGEGIAGQTVIFEGRHDEEIGSTSEESYSAIRIHCV